MTCMNGWTIAGSLGSVIGGVSGIAGVIAAIIIAKRAEHISKIQSARLEEERRLNVDRDCNKFLWENSKNKDFLELAYTNLKYDSERISIRPLYDSLTLQTFEVQEKIAKKYGLSDLLYEHVPIYDKCLEQTENLFAILGATNSHDTMLYERGKYWQRAIKRYADKPLSDDYEKLQKLVTDVLVGHYSGVYITYEEYITSTTRALKMANRYEPEYCIINDELNRASSEPIQYLMDKLNVRGCDEKRCCEILCIIIRWVAEYSNIEDKCKCIENNEDFKNVRNDNLYLSDVWNSNGVNITMEDLFLLSLYQVYKSIEKGKNNGSKDL